MFTNLLFLLAFFLIRYIIIINMCNANYEPFIIIFTDDTHFV